MIPAGVVTGLAGPPGVSKSTFALQLCIHRVLGLDLLGRSVGGGSPAIFITTEDDEAELWRRVDRILAHLGRSRAELDGLMLLPLTEDDPAVAWMDDRNGSVGETAKGEALWQWVRDVGAKLVVLDLLFDFWPGGNENQRGPATAYIRGVLSRAASRGGFGLVGITHPSVAAIREGRVFAGGTAVPGSFRSGLSYTPGENGTIELKLVKFNYTGPQPTRLLRWQDGYLVEVTDIEQSQAAVAAQAALWGEVLAGAFPDTNEWLGSTEVWERLGRQVKNVDGPDSWFRKRVERVLEEMTAAGGVLEGRDSPRDRGMSKTRREYRRLSPPDDSQVDPFS